jgi:hypothetical protein
LPAAFLRIPLGLAVGGIIGAAAAIDNEASGESGWVYVDEVESGTPKDEAIKKAARAYMPTAIKSFLWGVVGAIPVLVLRFFFGKRYGKFKAFSISIGFTFLLLAFQVVLKVQNVIDAPLGTGAAFSLSMMILLKNRERAAKNPQTEPCRDIY